MASCYGISGCAGDGRLCVAAQSNDKTKVVGFAPSSMSESSRDRILALSSKLSDLSESIGSQQRARRSLLEAKIEEIDRKVEALFAQMAKVSASLAAKVEADAKVRVLINSAHLMECQKWLWRKPICLCGQERKTAAAKFQMRIDDLESQLRVAHASNERLEATVSDLIREVHTLK